MVHPLGSGRRRHWSTAGRAAFVLVLAGLLAVSAASVSAADAPDASLDVTVEQLGDPHAPLPLAGAVLYEDRSSATAAKRAETQPPESAPVATTTGDAIAALALAHQGYPYVWAGNTPAGFDCSGFTQYVVLATVGIDIGHAVEGQPFAGAWVEYGAWQAGDLVFFQNTYRPGISHAGVYLGDGLFVHAENETTGVVVTSLYFDYYGARYYGAVRVA